MASTPIQSRDTLYPGGTFLDPISLDAGGVDAVLSTDTSGRLIVQSGSTEVFRVGTEGVRLKQGLSAGDSSKAVLSFSYAGTDLYSHEIISRHHAGQAQEQENQIAFRLWGYTSVAGVGAARPVTEAFKITGLGIETPGRIGMGSGQKIHLRGVTDPNWYVTADGATTDIAAGNLPVRLTSGYAPGSPTLVAFTNTRNVTIGGTADSGDKLRVHGTTRTGILVTDNVTGWISIDGGLSNNFSNTNGYTHIRRPSGGNGIVFGHENGTTLWGRFDSVGNLLLNGRLQVGPDSLTTHASGQVTIGTASEMASGWSGLPAQARLHVHGHLSVNEQIRALGDIRTSGGGFYEGNAAVKDTYLRYDTMISGPQTPGALRLTHTDNDNVLWDADRRLTVTTSGAATAGSTWVRTYDMVAKGAFPAYGLVYSQGKVFVTFWYDQHADIALSSVRYKKQDGSWTTPYTFTGVRSSTGVNNGHRHWVAPAPGGNYVTHVEITLVARSDAAFGLQRIAYVPDLPNSVSDTNVLMAEQDNTVYRSWKWRDTAAALRVLIDPNATYKLDVTAPTRLGNLYVLDGNITLNNSAGDYTGRWIGSSVERSILFGGYGGHGPMVIRNVGGQGVQLQADGVTNWTLGPDSFRIGNYGFAFFRWRDNVYPAPKDLLIGQNIEEQADRAGREVILEGGIGGYIGARNGGAIRLRPGGINAAGGGTGTPAAVSVEASSTHTSAHRMMQWLNPAGVAIAAVQGTGDLRVGSNADSNYLSLTATGEIFRFVQGAYGQKILLTGNGVDFNKPNDDAQYMARITTAGLQVKTITSGGVLGGAYNQMEIFANFYGVSTTLPALKIGTHDSAGAQRYPVQLFNGTNGRTVLNETGGNVLIGTSTDSGFKFEVNGTVRVVTNLVVGTGVTTTADDEAFHLRAKAWQKPAMIVSFPTGRPANTSEGWEVLRGYDDASNLRLAFEIWDDFAELRGTHPTYGKGGFRLKAAQAASVTVSVQDGMFDVELGSYADQQRLRFVQDYILKQKRSAGVSAARHVWLVDHEFAEDTATEQRGRYRLSVARNGSTWQADGMQAAFIAEATAAGKSIVTLGSNLLVVRPTGPVVDVLAGTGTGTPTGNGLRIKANAVDGNSGVLLLGVTSAYHSYIQASYWGGNYDRTLQLNPLGGGVVIGNAVASANLDVKDAIRIRANNTTGDAIMGRLLFGPASDTYQGNSAFIAAHSEVNWYQGAHLDFFTDYGPDQAQAQAPRRMRLSSRGNLLIGTIVDSTLYKLDVVGGARFTSITGPSGVLPITGMFDFGSTVGDKLLLYSNSYGIGIESGTLTAWSSSRHRWRINGTSASTGTEHMTLTANGLKVGGTGDPNYRVDVDGTFRATGTSLLQGLVSVQSHVYPTVSYTSDLGSGVLKFRTLNAAELVVATLVSQDEVITTGGRQMIGVSTVLVADAIAAAAVVTVKHNNLVLGDRIRLESRGQVEWMVVTSAATTVAGGYQYSVTRNHDGTGANNWIAGDGVQNTGRVASGFIDQYALSSVLGGMTAGPATAYMVRTGLAYNEIEPRALSGSLTGFYGYGAGVYGFAAGSYAASWISVDDTNGLRFMSGANEMGYVRTGTMKVGALMVTPTTTTIAGFTANATEFTSTSGQLKIYGNGTITSGTGAVGSSTMAFSLNANGSFTLRNYLVAGTAGMILGPDTASNMFFSGTGFILRFGLEVRANLDVDGLNFYDHNGDTAARFGRYGSQFFDVNGTERFRVNEEGLLMHDTNGDQRVLVDEEGVRLGRTGLQDPYLRALNDQVAIYAVGPVPGVGIPGVLEKKVQVLASGVVIGSTDADRSNVFVQHTGFDVRTGGVSDVSVTATGIRVGRLSNGIGASPNVWITPTQLMLRRGTGAATFLADVDGSGYLANTSIRWNTAGHFFIDNQATIGGWSITPTGISSGQLFIQPGVGIYYGASASWNDAGTPFFIGADGSFSLGDQFTYSQGTGLYLEGNGIFSGIIQATAGVFSDHGITIGDLTSVTSSTYSGLWIDSDNQWMTGHSGLGGLTQFVVGGNNGIRYISEDAYIALGSSVEIEGAVRVSGSLSVAQAPIGYDQIGGFFGSVGGVFKSSWKASATEYLRFTGTAVDLATANFDLHSTGIKLNGLRIALGGATALNAGVGLWAGANGEFRVGTALGNRLQVNAAGDLVLVAPNAVINGSTGWLGASNILSWTGTSVGLAGWAVSAAKFEKTTATGSIRLMSDSSVEYGGTAATAVPSIIAFTETTNSLVSFGRIYDAGMTSRFGLAFTPSYGAVGTDFEVSRNLSDGTLIRRIAGWNFNSTAIWKGETLVNNQDGAGVRMSAVNAGGGNFYTQGQQLQGFGVYWHRPANAGHVILGQIASNGSTIRSGFFGLQMMDHLGGEYFALAADTTSMSASGPQVYNRIAGWAFDARRLASPNSTVLLGNNLGPDDATGRVLIGNFTDGGVPVVRVKGPTGYTQMLYSSSGQWGLEGHDGASYVFQLGSTNQIAGWSFVPGKLTSGTGTGIMALDSANRRITIGGEGLFSAMSTGIFLGLETSAPKFRLADKLLFENNTLTVKGVVNATSGTFTGDILLLGGRVITEEYDGLNQITGSAILGDGGLKFNSWNKAVFADGIKWDSTTVGAGNFMTTKTWMRMGTVSYRPVSGENIPVFSIRTLLGSRLVFQSEAVFLESNAGGGGFSGGVRFLTDVSMNEQGITDASPGQVYDSAVNRTFRIRTGNTNRAAFEAMGSDPNQGYGQLYAGGNNQQGGGFEYTGTAHTGSGQAGAGRNALFRRTGGINFWTARNLHNSNDWEFRGQLVWADTSDATLKNVQGDIDGLAVVRAVRGVQYVWKSDETKTVHEGVLAQDVQKVLPSAVEVREDGTLAVRHLPLIGGLFAGLRGVLGYAEAEVKKLRRENAGLKKRMASIEERLAAIGA